MDVAKRAAFIIERALAYRLHVYLLTFLITLVAFNGPPYAQQAWLIALSFASLMAFIYVANKVTDKNEDSVNLNAGAIPDSSRTIALALAWAFAALPLGYILSLGNLRLTAVYLVVAVLGYLYSFPIRLFGRRFRFKQILFLKTFTSSLIWTLPGAGVAAAMTGEIDARIIFWFLIVFFSGAAIEIMWDIRDTKGDKQFDIDTIPNTFGVPAAKIISLALLGAATVVGYLMATSAYTFIALVVYVFIVLSAREGRSAWFYHGSVFPWIIALALVAMS